MINWILATMIVVGCVLGVTGFLFLLKDWPLVLGGVSLLVFVGGLVAIVKIKLDGDQKPLR